ncbi:ATP-grasp domain-containing protein [Streptomyces sp. XY332]|uniref:ATP-grasp domain-containing protein n=1 Tax=Streptomyces sp. XY332 TaxID=1415561 RepID=UPI0006B23742|nr:ATP-grasp domain-containing protein [Streptomyces sp. XY332]KOY57583.1 LigA protein [Streptomyces sp. XY332]
MTEPHPPRPTVVLVYQRTSLPWIFEGAQRAGIDVVLVPRPDESVSPDRLPPAVVELLPLDVEGDPAKALSVLKQRHESAPFDGITTLYDPAVPFVADVAEALGLPGLGRETARAVQDKRIMRRRLAEAGLNVPGFVTVDDPGAWTDATRLTFPVVVKPANGFSSLGVTKADSPEQLAAVVDEVWEVCRNSLNRVAGLVVEEYLDGPEFAVESLAHRGEVQVLSIGYKGEPAGPHFEEGVYRAPAALAPHVQEAVVREVVAAHSALGVSDGPTHTELRLRGGERPYLLELGARIGGSGVSHYIAGHVTGADLAADALRVAAGLGPAPLPGPPAQPARATGAAANYIVPCGGSGRITAIHGLDELAADPRVDHIVQMLHPGDVVRPYPEFTGYPAFVLSHHPSTEDAEAFHRTIEEIVRIEYAPVEGAQ